MGFSSQSRILSCTAAAALALGCGTPPPRDRIALALFDLGTAVERLATTAALPDAAAARRAVEVVEGEGSASWRFIDPNAPSFDRGRVVFSTFPARPLDEEPLVQGYLDVARTAPGNLTLSTQQIELIGEPAMRLETVGVGVLLGGGQVTLTGTVQANGAKLKDASVFSNESFPITPP